MTYKVMKDSVLIDLKENISENIGLYASFSNDDFLIDMQATETTQNSILKVSDPSNKSKDDLENAIKLYEYFQGLPLTLASNEKFWAYLTHTSFWDYMCQRWPISAAEGDEIEFIKTRYFFSTKNKTFYRNGLSRLWWFVHLTYDSTKEDPYYYTRIILSYQDLANLIIETISLSRNKTVLKTVLEVIKNIAALEEQNKIQKVKNKRIFLRDMTKYINFVGGVTLWDRLNEEEAYLKLWHYVESKIEYINDLKVEQYN
ncbi:DUF6339 family protein [Chryseomicrobium imtechense]